MQPRIDFPDQQFDPEIPPTWSEGSAIYHVNPRCRALREILPGRRRTQSRAPLGLALCEFCGKIQRLGHAG